MEERVLCPEVVQKMQFFGAVKLLCLSSHNYFFLKFFGHGITPGCSEMLRPSAFTWHCQKKNICFCFGCKVALFPKKNLCSQIFIKMYFFGKVTMSRRVFFQKRLAWCLRFFDNRVLFNHFWKNTKDIAFEHNGFFYICHLLQ